MDIKAKLTAERLQESLTIDEMIAMSESGGNLSIMREFIARFMIDPATGDYFPLDIIDTADDYSIKAHPAALRMAGKMTINRLVEFGNALRGGMEDLLVPPSNAA